MEMDRLSQEMWFVNKVEIYHDRGLKKKTEQEGKFFRWPAAFSNFRQIAKLHVSQ